MGLLSLCLFLTSLSAVASDEVFYLAGRTDIERLRTNHPSHYAKIGVLLFAMEHQRFAEVIDSLPLAFRPDSVVADLRPSVLSVGVVVTYRSRSYGFIALNDYENDRLRPALFFPDRRAAASEALAKHFESKRTAFRYDDDAGSLDEPRILRSVAPIFPLRAMLRSLSGYVVLKYTVDHQGRVQDIEVVDFSDYVFVESAIEAAKAMRYRPRFVDGQAVDTPGVSRKFSYETN